MKTLLKFKACEFRFRPHFSYLEFEVKSVESRATGKLTPSECMELGKYFMDAYYARAIRPEKSESGDPTTDPQSG